MFSMRTRIKTKKNIFYFSTRNDDFVYNMNNNPFDCREKDYKIKKLFKQ